MDWTTTAVAISIVSVIVAALAWYESNRSANAGEKSASAAAASLEIAKLALKTGQRPWVCLTGISPSSGTALIPFYTIRFDVSNLGTTPAFDLTVEYYIMTSAESCPTALHRTEMEPGSRLVLGPNKTIQPTRGVELTIEQIDSIQSGQLYLVTYGFVSYKDTFKEVHETRWCAYWRAGEFAAARLHNTST
jgi:hypothetical protein